MRWIKWGLFTLAAAAAVHWIAISCAPYGIMWMTMGRVARGKVNTIAHTERATADSRVVVKPSPDLLYSICAFDVGKRPLKIVTGAPQGTYWSVALYADNTDNFFTLNDVDAKEAPATLVLLGPGQSVPILEAGTRAVSAPSEKGLVLFRTLVSDEARAGEIDEARRQARCEPF